jgi:transcriptional regulator with XRE-family HTH domain
MDIKIFWGRIKQLLKKKQVTQAEMARACGIPFNTFHGWITKDIYPPLTDAYTIAHVLGVTIDYLVAGKDTAGKKTAAQLENAKKALKHAEETLDKIVL